MRRIAQFAPCLVTVVMVAACDASDDGPGPCGKSVDGVTGACEFTGLQWRRMKSLSAGGAGAPDLLLGLGPPPADRSNKLTEGGYPVTGDVLSPAAALGRRFYFDTRFSGNANLLDSLGRPMPWARAPRGEPTGLACASCHDPAHAGVDPGSVPGHVSVGAGWYDVNSQPTINAAYNTLFYWNGRVDSLWAQALAVTESGVSMNGTRLAVVWLMVDFYAKACQEIFGAPPLEVGFTSVRVRELLDPATGQCKLDDQMICPPEACRTIAGQAGCWPRFPLSGKPNATGMCTNPRTDAWDCMDAADRDKVGRSFVNFGKAIAAYEHALVHANSAFDQFIKAGPASPRISPEAKRGARLFVGKAACLDCHNGSGLTDQLFHNVGVPQVGVAVPTLDDCPAGAACDCVNTAEKPARNCLPWGAWDGIGKLRGNRYRRDLPWSDDVTDTSRAEYLRDGRFGAAPIESTKYQIPDVLDERLQGAWRTPSLRDVALTAPYMHNGVYRTLEEVVEHYNRGGAPGAPGHRAAQLKPLQLTGDEQRDLVEFLRTLTGAPLPAAIAGKPQP